MFSDPYNPEKARGYEQSQENAEKPTEILYAIHDTDPDTGTEFWYTKDPAGEKIPLDVQEDADGTLREVLPDHTLGREVQQDPTDDPERLRNLYGPTDPDNISPPSTAEQSLPSDKRTSPHPITLKESALGKPEATPTRAVVEEGSADPYFEPNAATAAREDGTTRKVSALVGAASGLPEFPLSGTQSRANALTSQTTKINAEIATSTPDNSPDIDNPAEFSEDVQNYHEKLEHNLDSIAATLMQKADTLSGLGMPDAARLFATKTEQIYATIKNEITTAGEDLAALTAIYTHYFEGTGTALIPKIDAVLTTDPSTIKFNLLLSQTTTIPELTYLADKLVSTRNTTQPQQ